MTKKLSLILAIVMFLDVVVPCLIHRSFAKQSVSTPSDAHVPASGKTFNYSGQYYDDFGYWYNDDAPSAKVTVEKSGVYQIQVSSLGRPLDYQILSSGGEPLAIAGYVSDPDNAVVTDKMASANTKTVSVYLKAGEEYYVPMYTDIIGLDEDDVFSLSVSPVSAPPGSQLKEFELSSSQFTCDSTAGLYTYAGNKHARSNIHYSLGDSQRIDSQHYTVSRRSSGLLGDQETTVSVVQWLATLFFVYGICEPLRLLIRTTFGSVSLDTLIFNHYSNTRLTFYEENGRVDGSTNLFINDTRAGSTVLDMVNKYYNYFRGIVILVYVILLLYIAIRILLKSTARDKDKYKNMLMDWARGILILFIFPYIIKYMILINESLVGIVEKEVKNKYFGGTASFMPSSNLNSDDIQFMQLKGSDVANSDLMEEYKEYALKAHSLGYAFIYFYLIISLFSFLIIYFKRLITILFLIVLFPFVALSYAADKVRDGKAQIFNNWFRELILNVFMQLFHAIAYVTVMAIITALMGGSGSPNVILVVIGIGYIKKSDELLKLLFPNAMRGGGAGTVKPVAQIAQTATAVAMYKKAKENISGTRKRLTNAMDKHLDSKETLLEKRRRDSEVKLASVREDKKEEEKTKADKLLEALGTAGAGAGAVAARPSSVSSMPADSSRTTPEGSTETTDAGTHGSESSSTTTPGGSRDTSDTRAEATNTNNVTMEQIETIARVYNTGDKQAQLRADMQERGVPKELQDKIMTLVAAKVATEELVTGKNAAGVTLTRRALTLNVKVITDILNQDSSDPTSASAMLKTYFADKQIAYSEYEYKDDRGNKISREEYVSLKRQLEREAKQKDNPEAKKRLEKIKPPTKKVRPAIPASEFLDKMKKEYMLDTHEQAIQASNASKWVGGQVGIVEPHVETRLLDDGTTETVVEDDLASIVGADGAIVEDALRTIKTRNDEKNLVALSGDAKKALHRRKKETVEHMQREFLPQGIGAVSSSEEQDFNEAAEIIIDLGEYKRQMDAGEIDGVEQSEMFALTSRLNELQARHQSINRLVGATVNTQSTPSTQVHTDTLIEEAKVDLGCSLDVAEFTAAQSVLALESEDRTYEQRSSLRKAGESLRRLDQESGDETVRVLLNRSEHDDIIDAESLDDVLSGRGFIEGEDRTQEEIIHEKFIEEKIHIRMQLSEEARAKLKVQAIRARAESIGAITSATAGTIAAAGTGIATGALMGGAASQTTARDLLTSVNAGVGLEKWAEKAVPGSLSAVGGTLGSEEMEVLSSTTSAIIERANPEPEKNSDVSRRVADNSKAARRTREFAKKFTRN